jgi:hypothetical protein
MFLAAIRPVTRSGTILPETSFSGWTPISAPSLSTESTTASFHSGTSLSMGILLSGSPQSPPISIVFTGPWKPRRSS